MGGALCAVVLDFAKPETLRPALVGVDTVFLLGAGGIGDAMIDLDRLYRSGAGAGATSAVKDVTGREPIGCQ